MVGKVLKKTGAWIIAVMIAITLMSGMASQSYAAEPENKTDAGVMEVGEYSIAPNSTSLPNSLEIMEDPDSTDDSSLMGQPQNQEEDTVAFGTEEEPTDNDGGEPAETVAPEENIEPEAPEATQSVTENEAVEDRDPALTRGKVKAPGRVNLTSAKRSGTTVTVTWKKVSGASGYRIYRKTVGKTRYNRIGDYSAKTFKMTNKGLAKGATYRYAARAYKTYKATQWYNKKTGKWQDSKPAKKYRGKSRTVNKRKYGELSNIRQVKVPTYKPVYKDLYYQGGGYMSDIDLYGFDATKGNFLAKTTTGYWRLRADDRGITAIKYNKKFKRTSEKKIKKELKYFIGFHEGKQNYYLFFSQANAKESKKKEVLRVVKYTKAWKRVKSTSIYGQNAVIIGEFGLDAVEYGGYLFVHTDHTMFTSEDGLNHEANYVAKVRVSDMRFIESTEMGKDTDFTCSHSFDQHITVDSSGNLILLNKGDYTGAEMIATFEKKATQKGLFENAYFDCFQSALIENPYDGGDGTWGFENFVYLGGVEASDSSYITGGSSLRLNKNWSKNRVKNIFITVTPRSAVTKKTVYTPAGDDWGYETRLFAKKSASKVKWITGYKESGKISCGKPFLLKINKNKYCLIWSRIKAGRYETDQTGKVSYVMLDGKGNKLTRVKTISSYMSDCEPVVNGNNVEWFYTPYYAATKLIRLNTATGKVTRISSAGK